MFKGLFSPVCVENGICFRKTRELARDAESCEQKSDVICAYGKRNLLTELLFSQNLPCFNVVAILKGFALRIQLT